MKDNMSNYSNFQYKELDPKTQTTSPYRNGLKDRNFVNPSLISHDVFYNQEYPQRDPIIPYCRKKQEVSEKITRSRCITPQPSRNSPNKSERISVQRERNNINYNNILKIEEKPILKTETEFKNNKQTKQENEFYEPEPINQIYENLQNNKEIDKNFNKDENYNYDNKSVKSIKSSTVSSFTRNADNLICDYCVNQDIIDRKKKEQELQNKLNLQQKSALNEYNQASLREEYLKNQEKKKLIKENANFLVQTIENKKYNNNNVKNIEKLTEIEHLRLIEENLKEENFKKSQLEKEKTINYRQQLEKQMENKYYENNQKLNENKSMKNLGLEINNQYNNPYLPKKEDYINEIERQKEELYKKKLMEKEFDKNYIELSQKQQRKFNEDENKIIREDYKRKQEYAQRILQDIEERKKKKEMQKMNENSAFKQYYDQMIEEQRKEQIKEYYDKKKREEDISNSLKQQIDTKRFKNQSQNEEKLKKNLMEIDDILSAQRKKIYCCKNCNKSYPKTLLNKCCH